MIRKAKAVWRGSGRAGNGDLSSDSGVLANTPYSFRTRFENEKGTNPEELIAAAHAGCWLRPDPASECTDSGSGHVRSIGAGRRAELPGFQGAQGRDHIGREAGLMERASGSMVCKDDRSQFIMANS
jgi:hypothetical protein